MSKSDWRDWMLSFGPVTGQVGERRLLPMRIGWIRYKSEKLVLDAGLKIHAIIVDGRSFPVGPGEAQELPFGDERAKVTIYNIDYVAASEHKEIALDVEFLEPFAGVADISGKAKVR